MAATTLPTTVSGAGSRVHLARVAIAIALVALLLGLAFVIGRVSAPVTTRIVHAVTPASVAPVAPPAASPVCRMGRPC